MNRTSRPTRRGAHTLTAVALAAASLSAAASTLTDYGLGHYATIEAWTQSSTVTRTAEAPADYGIGHYPTVAAWIAAGSHSAGRAGTGTLAAR